MGLTNWARYTLLIQALCFWGPRTLVGEALSDQDGLRECLRLPRAGPRPSSPADRCPLCAPPLQGKPSGIRAGRKLKNHRQHERWARTAYSKANTTASLKAKPLGMSCSMAKGIVLEKM